MGRVTHGQSGAARSAGCERLRAGGGVRGGRRAMGDMYNVNADQMAVACAAAFGARTA